MEGKGFILVPANGADRHGRKSSVACFVWAKVTEESTMKGATWQDISAQLQRSMGTMLSAGLACVRSVPSEIFGNSQ
jgi:hypothetical protein